MRKTPFSQGEGEILWSKVIGRVQTRTLHHIKHVLLDMNKLKFRYEYLMKYIMDCLFWMSHPDTLTLSIPSRFVAMAYVMFSILTFSIFFLFMIFKIFTLKSQHFANFVQQFLEELKCRQEGNCSCETMDKCWSHFLKDFDVYVNNMTSEKDELEFVFTFTWHYIS